MFGWRHHWIVSLVLQFFLSRDEWLHSGFSMYQTCSILLLTWWYCSITWWYSIKSSWYSISFLGDCNEKLYSHPSSPHVWSCLYYVKMIDQSATSSGWFKNPIFFHFISKWSLVNLALCNLHAQIPLYLMEQDAEDRGALPCYTDTLGQSFLKAACQPK